MTISELLGLSKPNALEDLLGIKDTMKDLIQPNTPIDPSIFNKQEKKKPDILSRIKGLKDKIKSNK